MKTPDADDDADRIAAQIFDLLDQRAPDGSICPSEVARALHPAEAAWRAAMPRIREVARDLAARGQLRVTRRGVDVDATARGGPIRLRR